MGEQLRQWRDAAGLRQDDIATAARAHGLDWTRDTVASLEAGRRELSLSEFVALRGSPVEREELRTLFTAQASRRLPADVAASQEAELKAARKLRTSPASIVTAAHRLWGRSLTEERDTRVKRSIGIGGVVEHVDSMKARGLRSRQGPPAGVITMERMVQARRGHVTRALVAELREALKRARR